MDGWMDGYMDGLRNAQLCDAELLQLCGEYGENSSGLDSKSLDPVSLMNFLVELWMCPLAMIYQQLLGGEQYVSMCGVKLEGFDICVDTRLYLKGRHC